MADRDPNGLRRILQQGYRYALALTHDAAAADDLLQTAWESVLKADGPWDIAYLRRAIRSRFIDAGRRRHLVPVPTEDVGTDRAVRPRDVMQQQTLARALGALSAEEREIVFLTLVEGHTAAEVGALVGRPRSTVLSMVRRARQKLQRLLSPVEAIND